MANSLEPPVGSDPGLREGNNKTSLCVLVGWEEPKNVCRMLFSQRCWGGSGKLKALPRSTGSQVPTQQTNVVPFLLPFTPLLNVAPERRQTSCCKVVNGLGPSSGAGPECMPTEPWVPR